MSSALLTSLYQGAQLTSAFSIRSIHRLLNFFDSPLIKSSDNPVGCTLPQQTLTKIKNLTPLKRRPSIPLKSSKFQKMAYQETIPSDNVARPDFQVQDPRWPPQTIYLCPSENYSKRHLKSLLNEVVADGIDIHGPSNANNQSGSKSMKAIAFDMEWCHDWSRKCARTTSLIQLAGRSKVLIIQLVQLDGQKWKEATFPQCLADLITSTEIIKMGAGIISDERKIDQDIWIDSHDQIVKLKNYLEINDLIKKFDSQAKEEIGNGTFSLQKLVDRYLNLHLPKTKKLTISNWETTQLTSSQAHYAAADVVTVIRIYERLMSSGDGNLNDVKPLLKATQPPRKSDLPFADPPKKPKSSKKKRPAPKGPSTNSTASIFMWIISK
ncbi:uncharacterized protein MELLADRAFT_112782 [Melampsora larici-populina 98AG31]|uniref:3'-5' exonuclease domain-containing protein n=1 Tax=Melampsora larici-populina (strain 98AG31 / pathotype 3-4-7) TaxID=747676 RepID=F4S7K6_MELLP|nr:uncharacterized protein MELLADRAFT_112782 [Melampsora larici-populina 98AG31]EGF99375.1 hypothetical protein MELLADRAFT_112782 [Melampsora larici-populina 98AG31]